MAKDFRASQVRTNRIIASGSQSLSTGVGYIPALMIYSASSATGITGSFESGMTGSVGTDVYMFVSGTIGLSANIFS